MSSFERPQTIMEALEAIDRYDYALPALQREFVWKPQQIYCLFDSLMKGYPIGSFLLWELEPETAQKFRFYQFMRDYHEWSNLAEAPDHDLAPYRNPVTQHIGCVSHDHHGIWSVPYACLSDEEEPMLTNFRLLAETINEIIKRSTPC